VFRTGAVDGTTGPVTIGGRSGFRNSMRFTVAAVTAPRTMRRPRAWTVFEPLLPMLDSDPVVVTSMPQPVTMMRAPGPSAISVPVILTASLPITSMSPPPSGPLASMSLTVMSPADVCRKTKPPKPPLPAATIGAT
jgi:hypothetical protein